VVYTQVPVGILKKSRRGFLDFELVKRVKKGATPAKHFTLIYTEISIFAAFTRAATWLGGSGQIVLARGSIWALTNCKGPNLQDSFFSYYQTLRACFH
jgi:hypothetical protein